MQQKSSSFSIKNWSDDDKPREKLVHKGSSVLSNAELIAILIGSGTKMKQQWRSPKEFWPPQTIT